MQLNLMSLFGRRPDTEDEPAEDVSVDYDPTEDLVESPVPRSAKATKGRGRYPDAPRLASPLKWSLSRVANHVTFSDKRMVAWYVLDPQRWSFRTVADGESLIEAHASQIAELVGRTVYGRITTRPYAVETWAEAAWNNSPAPTEGFAKILERDQVQLSSRMQSDKLVYFGVDLGSRSSALDLTGRVIADVARRELEALQHRLDEIDDVMAGPGVDAIPAVGNDMAWLLARSFALGCPAPVQDTVEETHWSKEDLHEFTGSTHWSAEPLAQSVRIDTTMGEQPITRHVVVLTVGRMGELHIPEVDEPWIAKTDKLPFPVEWAFRVDVRSSHETSKEMNKLSDRVLAQRDHYLDDHGKQPPRQLARQAERAAAVEDEQRSGFDGLATRTRGWYRIAVSARTQEEALQRAKVVQKIYKPAIKIEREFDQFRLAREFVPMEPLANTGHTRHLPILKLAAGVPAATAEVGDKRGVLIGYTSGFAERPVTWDPWYGPEVVEGSGLVPIVGGLGAGKSFFAGGVVYKTGAQGVPWTVLDPSGRLGALADLPEFRGVARAVNLLQSEPGALNPYALVPEPQLEWFRDEPDPQHALALAKSAAEAQRRDLMTDTLRWCLPAEDQNDPGALSILRDAVSRAEARPHSTAHGVLISLNHNVDDDHDLASRVVRRLREASERELSRLFFATPSGGNHGESLSDRRMTFFSLKGLAQIDESKPKSEWSFDELMSRPVMSLAAWSALRSVYRADFHERKGMFLDEVHEITAVSTGRTLVQKVATDTRKHDIAALVSTQNAANVIGQNINNFVGAAFVGKTTDDEAQAHNCRLLGLPVGVGYEAEFAKLSRRSRRSEITGTPREFIFRDGMGGEDGKGGVEKIRVDYSNHERLTVALNTTADPAKRRGLELVAEEGAA
ncbi:ATP-binding protein [Cellulomonas fengjieae]|uniref:ATP-binding protein n=1 Tax=Cellulomonas fengjieae TaxID=2819978 RepID=UPI001AAEB78E|nr:ATP-binding protein [Cellulomonas fengjieae]MBO3102213.1 ATP-binding protein [Cellulomonas fengjieae]